MKVISLNIGKTQTIKWKNKTTKTAFFKKPVDEALHLSLLKFDDDEQADPRYHGGVNKAVYSYDMAHYEQWKKVLPRDDWGFGMFGENLTTQGLLDSEACIGNIYKIGTAKLQVTEPRFPCMKLNMRFQLSTMVKLFKQQKRNGIYFKVAEQGTIKAGDAIELVQQSSYDITVQHLVESYYSRGADKLLLYQILGIEFLSPSLRKDFEGFS